MRYLKQIRIAFIKTQSISSETCISYLSCIFVALGQKKTSDWQPSEIFHTGGYRLAANITFKTTVYTYCCLKIHSRDVQIQLVISRLIIDLWRPFIFFFIKIIYFFSSLSVKWTQFYMLFGIKITIFKAFLSFSSN